MATQAMLDALDAAIAGGLTEVRNGDKIVKYQTTADLITARAAMAALLAAQQDSTRKTPRYQLADFRDP